MTPPQPTLAISKQTSYLDGVILYEKINPKTIKALIKSDKLKSDWDLNIRSQKMANELWKNEKAQLEAYLKNYDRSKKAISVKYKKYDHKWGRVYPVKSLGLTSLCKKTRNTLIKDTYYDFDLKNAQIDLTRYICEHEEIPCDTIQKYCNNRKEILTELAEHYGTDNDKTKKLMLRLSFFGTLYGWFQESGIDEKPSTQFIKDYIGELNTIAKVCKNRNPILYKSISQSKESKNEDMHNVLGSFFAYFLQEYELRIVEKMIQWLMDEAKVIRDESSDIRIVTYEFDGIKLLKEKVDKYPGGKEQLLRDLNDKTLELTGFKMTWEEKVITDYHDISKELAEIEDEPEPLTEKQKDANEFQEQFRAYADEFEKTHFKIVKKGLYVELYENGEYEVRKEQKLIECYKHLSIGKGKAPGASERGFITHWTKSNPSIRQMEDMDVYPPPMKCPDNAFNMWKPFKMELVTEWEHHQEGLDFFLNHIKILCNHEIPVYNYFLKWNAQFIQKPADKSGKCPNFQSEAQGTGKGSYILLVKKMLGDDKVLCTTNPSRDVWGSFNPMMKNAYFVFLDELEKKYSCEKDGELKALVTEPTINISCKGVDPYEVRSCHRFCSATNKEEGGVSTKPGDRRNLIINCSEELAAPTPNNKAYWTKYYTYLEDVNIIKTVYEYFRSENNFPDVNSIKTDPIPKTEFQEQLKTLSQSKYSQWLEYYTRDNLDKSEKTVPSAEVYESFRHFLPMVGYPNDIPYLKFCCNIKLIKKGLLDSKATKERSYIIFDFVKLRDFYGIKD